MKNLFILFLVSLGFILASCGDKCDDVNCGSNGTCVDGTCDCDEGYTGENCQTKTCAIVDCGANGTCVDGTCNCDEGYSGVNCEINVCDDVDCNNGTCNTVTGECNCDEGYEGEFCDVEIRAKFLGTWNTDAWICDGDIDMETLIFLEGNAIDEMLLTDDGQDFFIRCVIDGDIFTIPSQAIDVGGIVATYEGDGFIEDDKLTLNISAMALGEMIECTGVFER